MNPFADISGQIEQTGTLGRKAADRGETCETIIVFRHIEFGEPIGRFIGNVACFFRHGPRITPGKNRLLRATGQTREPFPLGLAQQAIAIAGGTHADEPAIGNSVERRQPLLNAQPIGKFRSRHP